MITAVMMIFLLSCRQIPFCLLTSFYRFLVATFVFTLRETNSCEYIFDLIQVSCNNILTDRFW